MRSSWFMLHDKVSYVFHLMSFIYSICWIPRHPPSASKDASMDSISWYPKPRSSKATRAKRCKSELRTERRPVTKHCRVWVKPLASKEHCLRFLRWSRHRKFSTMFHGYKIWLRPQTSGDGDALAIESPSRQCLSCWGSSGTQITHQHPVLRIPMCSTWLYLFGYFLQSMKQYNYFINLMFSEDFPYQFASLRAYKMSFPRLISSSFTKLLQAKFQFLQGPG